MTDNKPTIILDFDGVIHSYLSGWQGTSDIPDPPVQDVDKYIQKLREDFEVVVFSSRCSSEEGVEAIRNYLEEHNIEVDQVVENKVPALLSVDDRAINFDGEWNDELLEKIRNFESWVDKENEELKEVLNNFEEYEDR